VSLPKRLLALEGEVFMSREQFEREGRAYLKAVFTIVREEVRDRATLERIADRIATLPTLGPVGLEP